MPGADNSQRELISRISTMSLPRLGRADVPESLELALSTAMAKSAASRYSSAHAFALALQRIQAELNLSVTPFEVLEEPHPEESHPDDGYEETRVRSIAAIDPERTGSAPTFPARTRPQGLTDVPPSAFTPAAAPAALPPAAAPAPVRHGRRFPATFSPASSPETPLVSGHTPPCCVAAPPTTGRPWACRTPPSSGQAFLRPDPKAPAGSPIPGHPAVVNRSSTPLSAVRSEPRSPSRGPDRTTVSGTSGWPFGCRRAGPRGDCGNCPGVLDAGAERCQD